MLEEQKKKKKKDTPGSQHRKQKETERVTDKQRMKGKADREQKHCRNTKKLLCIVKHEREYAKRLQIKIESNKKL